MRGHIEAPAWSIPIPAGEPRQLGEMPVSQATYFPDGRLLLLEGKNIFVADRDGLNPRQLFATENYSLGDFAWNPSISPDGKRIVVTTSSSLTELAAGRQFPSPCAGLRHGKRYLEPRWQIRSLRNTEPR